MKKVEAIDILESRAVCMECVISKYDCDACDEAFEMAISALEQEPCEDAISREAVVDDFIEWREKLEYAVGEDYSGVHLLNVAIQKIWDMPSVTPSRRKGHWIDYSDEGFVECPFCGHATNCEDNIDELHYCFYCGAELSADMRGSDE